MYTQCILYLKDSYRLKHFHRQEFVECYIFSLSKFSVFKRFVHDTVVSPSGTSVEFCMLYYSKSMRCETKSDNI